MVVVKEISSGKELLDSEYITDEEAFSDAGSDVSDDDLHQETLMDRIAALGDIIPASTRDNAVKNVQSTVSALWSVVRMAGSAAWILMTTTVVVALPLMYEIDKDQAMKQFEQEQQMAQKVLFEC